jgi:L-Ala-D/L-Glu epimerase
LAVEEILQLVDLAAPGNSSAKCAVDIALHDWIGKRLQMPLHRLFGWKAHVQAVSSFTIGIDEPAVIAQKIDEAEGYPILKIKLGSADDKELISTIRRQTEKRIRVDANEGWKDRQTALTMVEWLQDQNVEFVEQPMPAAQLDDIRWLKEKTALPLIADESVMHLADLPELAGAFNGINIKLMKCGGIREAIKMIHTAEALGMCVMLGCMIESAVGISAAAQLAPMARYLDLDGNALIDNDPFDGSRNRGGIVVPMNRPGIGAIPFVT